MFLLTRRTQFWQLRQKIFDKNPRIFRSTSKNDNKNSFQGKNTSQNIHMDTRKQCWEPSRGIFTWSRKSLPSMSDCYEKTFYSDTNFPPKIILWKRRLPYWQPCGASSKKKTKTFRGLTRNENKILLYSQIIFQPKTFYWHLVRSVNNPARERCKKAEKNRLDSEND